MVIGTSKKRAWKKHTFIGHKMKACMHVALIPSMNEDVEYFGYLNIERVLNNQDLTRAKQRMELFDHLRTAHQ